MAEEQAAEVYKVTATDDKGNQIVKHVKADNLRAYMAMMSSEYGNIKREGMTMAEVPADIRAQLEGDQPAQ
jgi:cell pole-organizing protein PopZ